MIFVITVCIFFAASSSLSSATPLSVKNCLISLSSILKSSSPVMPSASNSIIIKPASSSLILPSLRKPASALPFSLVASIAPFNPFTAAFCSSFSGIVFPLSVSQFPVILMLKSLFIFAPFCVIFYLFLLLFILFFCYFVTHIIIVFFRTVLYGSVCIVSC